MSFGFAIGDFVVLAQLAWNVVQNSRRACGAHAALTREVTSLHIVLRRLRIEIETTTSPINRVNDGRREELQTILKGCTQVLKVLEQVLVKYNGLSEERRATTKLWQKIRFGNGEMKDMDHIKQEIATYTSYITLFLNLLSMGSQGRVEEHMETHSLELRELRQSLNWITASLQASGEHGEGSILTSYADDDKIIWKEFRRELLQEGFSSAVLRKHKTVIKDYVIELGSRGALDTPVCGEYEIDYDGELEKETLEQRQSESVEYDTDAERNIDMSLKGIRPSSREQSPSIQNSRLNSQSSVSSEVTEDVQIGAETLSPTSNLASPPLPISDPAINRQPKPKIASVEEIEDEEFEIGAHPNCELAPDIHYESENLSKKVAEISSQQTFNTASRPVKNQAEEHNKEVEEPAKIPKAPGNPERKFILWRGPRGEPGDPNRSPENHTFHKSASTAIEPEVAKTIKSDVKDPFLKAPGSEYNPMTKAGLQRHTAPRTATTYGEEKDVWERIREDFPEPHEHKPFAQNVKWGSSDDKDPQLKSSRPSHWQERASRYSPHAATTYGDEKDVWERIREDFPEPYAYTPSHGENQYYNSEDSSNGSSTGDEWEYEKGIKDDQFINRKTWKVDPITGLRVIERSPPFPRKHAEATQRRLNDQEDSDSQQESESHANPSSRRQEAQRNRFDHNSFAAEYMRTSRRPPIRTSYPNRGYRRESPDSYDSRSASPTREKHRKGKSASDHARAGLDSLGIQGSVTSSDNHRDTYSTEPFLDTLPADEKDDSSRWDRLRSLAEEYIQSAQRKPSKSVDNNEVYA